MTKESKYFIIKYTENENNYIDKLVNIIDNEAKRIMDYFEIESINERFNVDIIPTKEDFDNVFYDKMHFKPDKSGVGFVDKKVMYCLSFNDYKNTNHKDYSFNDFINIIVHEFVHAVHEYKTNGKASIRCINEGLACYLSNQFDNKEYNFDASVDDIVNDKYVNYDNYYVLIKYVFDNYNKEFCDKMIYDKEFARNEIENIYNKYVNSLRK